MNIIDFEEKKKHGSESFPIEYYFLTNEHYRYVMQLHWHKEFEIIRVLAGQLRVFLNNTEYLARAGDIVFIVGHVLHRAEPMDCVYECIVFDLNLIRGNPGGKAAEYLVPLMAGTTEIERVIYPENTPLYRSATRLFEMMCTVVPFYELSVCGILCDIFYHLLAAGKIHRVQGDSHGNKRKIMATLIDWIEKNYSEHITLKKLAELSGFNEKYLCRVFRDFTGQTPTEYINRLRCERASFEMTVNRKSATEAAYDSGFNELSHFSRTFKKYTGVSPREFCRNLKGEKDPTV